MKKSLYSLVKKIGLALFLFISVVSMGVNIGQYFLFKNVCSEKSRIFADGEDNKVIETLRDCGAIGATQLFVDIESGQRNVTKRLLSFSHAHSLDDIDVQWKDDENLLISYASNVDYICKYDENILWNNIDIDISKRILEGSDSLDPSSSFEK